jgi:hypothetical protein
MFLQITSSEALIGGVVTLLAGGTATAVILWLLNWRKYKTETLPAEGSGMDVLLSKLKGLMTEKLDDAGRIQRMATELSGVRVLLEVRDQELARQGDMLKDILVEQGRAEEREKQCQTRLSQVLEKLDEYDDLHNVNRRLVQDNLRMQGEIDEYVSGSKTDVR